MMLESLPESRKSGNGWKMTWQPIPSVRGNGWERLGPSHCGFSWGNAYRQGRGRSQWSRGHIPWDKGSEMGWLLEMLFGTSICVVAVRSWNRSWLSVLRSLGRRARTAAETISSHLFCKITIDRTQFETTQILDKKQRWNKYLFPANSRNLRLQESTWF